MAAPSPPLPTPPLRGQRFQNMWEVEAVGAWCKEWETVIGTKAVWLPVLQAPSLLINRFSFCFHFFPSSVTHLLSSLTSPFRGELNLSNMCYHLISILRGGARLWKRAERGPHAH